MKPWGDRARFASPQFRFAAVAKPHALSDEGGIRFNRRQLGTKTDRIRFNESEKLLTWGFRFYETVTPIKPDATFVTQRVWFGDSSEAKLGAGEARRHGFIEAEAPGQQFF
jgi:D-alanyl-D-alanine carboxypeptidase